jgi:hypothetical protein
MYALPKSYVKRYGVSVDTGISDISAKVALFLKDYGIRYVTLARDVLVEGNSWEMAAVMAVLAKPGAYSGTVVDYVKNERVTFGPVPGLRAKRKLATNLITMNEIPTISLSR